MKNELINTGNDIFQLRLKSFMLIYCKIAIMFDFKNINLI